MALKYWVVSSVVLAFTNLGVELRCLGEVGEDYALAGIDRRRLGRCVAGIAFGDGRCDVVECLREIQRLARWGTGQGTRYWAGY